MAWHDTRHTTSLKLQPITPNFINQLMTGGNTATLLLDEVSQTAYYILYQMGGTVDLVEVDLRTKQHHTTPITNTQQYPLFGLQFAP